MDWQGWAHVLKDELQMDWEPIAVGFLGSLPAGVAPPEGKLSVCQALKRAGEGGSATLTADTCGCPGGLVNLGLGQVPASGKERLVAFLVDREQAFCSRAALDRGQHVVEPPLGMASHVCFAPLAVAAFLPDVVVFLGRPGSLHRLVGLANYWEGGALPTDLSGPACRGGITFPLRTGNLGLTLLDFGARRLAGFPDETLLVSVPFHRLIGIMAALDRGVHRASSQDREAAEREIESLGPVEKAHA